MTVQRPTGEYERIQQGQNNGLACPHCKSTSGHYAVCPLINRAVAEAKSAAAGQWSETDHIFARGLGIILD